MKSKITFEFNGLTRMVLALGTLVLLATLATDDNRVYGRSALSWLGWYSGGDKAAVAAAPARKPATNPVRSKITPPPKPAPAAPEAACTLDITKVSVGECRKDAATGNLPKVLVAVFVEWSMPPAGQTIDITVDGQTKSINPTVNGCQHYVQFIVDADGTTKDASAQFSGGTCLAPTVFFDVPSACTGAATCSGNNTAIGGTVYSDFDSDGTRDPSEFGLEGAQIDVFDNAENLLCSTVSDFQGKWTCTGLTTGQKVRVEISNLPAGYTPGGVGPDNFGGVVQFATVGSDCSVDFGLLDAGNYCENNPYVVTPCYLRGDPLAGGTSGSLPVLVAVPYSASGDGGSNVYLTLNSEMGSTWGVAYQKETKKVFTSAFLKRHCGWGPGGLGAIYVTNTSVMPPASSSGNTSLYFNLDSYGINTGNEASLTRNLGANLNQPTYDPQVFDLIGKWGLGDIDISEDGDSLFIVNLYNRSIVTVAIGNPAVAVVPASAVSEVTIPDPGCADNSDWRPFALKYRNGKLYVGGVCSAQTSQNTANLSAHIYEFDPPTATFTEILSFPLDYSKGIVLTGLSHCSNWNPWTNNFNDLPAGGIELCYPQPMLSDIEFDVYGNMMVAFNDRAGHQMGWYDYGTTPPSTQTWKGNSGGDILRVVNNNGTWLIERNGTAGFDTGCGVNNGQGPCGGEFYCQDSYLSAHQEAVHGGVAVHPSNNELLLDMMDPTSAFSGGLAWYNNATGVKNRAYRVYYSDNNGNSGLSGKAAGLGDVELLCGEAPIELGNFVWVDSDQDGIQDPGELPLSGVKVSLYKGNTLLKTVTTDANGQYKFTVADGVLPNMNYCIGFGTGGQATSGILTVGGNSYALTQQNIGFGANNDNNDSDAGIGGGNLPAALQGIPVICLTTGNRGDNDNTLDVGLIPVVDFGDLPDNNLAGSYPTNTTNGAGEGIGPSHQILPTLKMGATVDYESNGQPSANADGDDNNGAPDDEDGVILPMFLAGQTANLSITVMNMTGSTAKLTGFFDWDGNHVFGGGSEMVSVNVPNGTNGPVAMSVPVPTNAAQNTQIGVRFRLSTNATASMSPTGPAPDGEVEDYLAQVMAFDWGDLPDLGVGTASGDYQTNANDNGPSHKIVPNIKIGATIDFETNGQPNAGATGDGSDEDGIASFPQFKTGQPAAIDVTVMNMTGQAATLYGFFDWNKDGDFLDINEQASVLVPDNTNGVIQLNAIVPSDAVVNMPLGARFRLSTDPAAASPVGQAPNGEVEDYLIQVVAIDYGDLPDGNTPGSYPTDGSNGAGEGIGPCHVINPNIKLGATVDAEDAGLPSSNAQGDDINGSDDDDGIASFPMFIAGQNATVAVSVMNTAGAAKLYGFIDWNHDGDFNDAFESVTANVPNNTMGTVNLIFSVPANAVLNTDIGARFRISTATNLTATGPACAPDGEVEDYLVQVMSFDYGDLPDAGPGTGPGDYQVLISDNGPSHKIVTGLKLGASVDGETNGQQSANANGDGNDEDGIAAFPQFSAGQVATIDVSVMNMTAQAAILYGYFDWNKDGDFEDANEQSSVGIPVGTNGTVQINAYVPADVILNMPLGARFRLSTDVAAAASPQGQAPDGEVEDYLIQVIAIDYGDLPDANTANSYPTDLNNGGGQGVGPSHVIVNGLKLGATVDGEADGQVSNDAFGDDNVGSPDDEDGVALPMLIAGQTATVPVTYMNMTGSSAKITLFADWNADGDFNDAGEMVSTSVGANTSGTTNLLVPVPAGAVLNTNIGIRVRLSTNAAAAMLPTGPAPDGEVEDYLAQVMAFDWGDLADNGASGYPTNSTDAGEGVGPSHKIRSGLKLGASVDAENDGQPSANADGDDANGIDDENGIAAFPTFTAGQTADIPVSVMNMTGEAAILYGFIDWNKDGDFNDLNEQASVAVPDNTNGLIHLFVNVPGNAVLNMGLGARFRLSTDDIADAIPVGPAPDGEVEDYLITVTGFDYGDLADNDAPGSYPTNETNGGEGPGACHKVVPGLKIGATVDNEVLANPSAAANGDDLNGADDEDGIVSFPTFTAGQNATVVVSVMNMMTPAAAATLYGFIDWNQDGDFNDANETATAPVPNGTNGNVNLVFSVPVTAVLNADLGARFRLSTQTGLTASGCAPDGEVEDYYVQATGVDYGDLPDNNTPGTYPTDATNGGGEGIGACHTIVTGLKIGSEVTPESAALPSANANGDDNNGTDDEDGILEFPMFTAGQPATVSVYVMDMLTNGADATLYGFIDWNHDGDFNDADEKVTAFVPNGTNAFVNLNFDVPANAVTSSLVGARFRLSTLGNLGATDCAPDGEVEDYLIMVNAVDYGDLPDNNGPGSYPTDNTNGSGEGVGPCHTLVTGLKIGATVDGEAGGMPSGGGNGDDLNGSDDEDGIAMFPMFYAGQQATVAVNVMNMLTSGASATLYGFIDWNQDGDFLDANESVSAFVANGTNGPVNLVFDVPLNAVINTGLGARFRLSTQSGLGATGCAPDGEVEDYIVMAGAIDFGDLPDDDQPGSYPTNPNDGSGEGVGACHAIVAGLKIGSTVDPEGAALPSADGTGDDNNPVGGTDDEDGITAFPMFLAGQNATVVVNVMNMIPDGPTAYLYGFADWNQDGDFNDANESVSIPVANGTNGPVNLTFSVPANAVLNEDLGIRFRISTQDDLGATGCAPDGEVEDYFIQVMAFDFGDLADNNAPGSYPTNATDGGEGVGPSHKIVNGLKMGASVDFESAGQPSANADGDDANGDDEDGIASFPAFEAGTPATITVNVMNMMEDGAPAVLYGFIDWNKDGDFDDANERFSTTVPDGTNGNVSLNVNVPEDAVLNMPLGARFRLSTDDVAASTPEGPAPNGEVEDYLVTVLAYDYGDLPDNDTPNSFPTNNFNGGEGAPAKHQIIAALRLGAVEDAETDGQPNAQANGDDTGGSPDDEDGVVFATPLVPGQTACLRITAVNTTGSNAYLQAWMDFNGNGKFDAGEMLTTGNFSAAGAIIPNGGVNNAPYCFTVPAGASFEGGVLAARFRLSSAGSLGYSGTTNTGEVEDYLLPLAKIGNLVWEDVNGNGMQDEPGSAGINGVNVQLTYAGPDNDLNTAGDNLSFTTTTSTMTVDGQYMFVGLIPGTYKVGVPTTPAGFNPTGTDAAGDEIDSDNPNGVVFTIPDPVLLPLSEDGTGDVPGVVFPDAQDNLTFDFGFYKPASIGDYAWIDENGNGIQDNGEDPLPDVKVVLTGTDGLGNPVMNMTTTGPNGEYLFDNLVPGSYKLSFTAPSGSDYVMTDANQGGDDTADSDADPGMGGMTVFEVLTSGEYNPTYDAGFYEPAEIGNYTWIDDNANGIQDGNEAPLPGVLVILTGTTGSGEPVNESALTDANGLYLFDNLQPGTYKLTFQTPLGGYVSTTANDPDANPNDEDDSDADPAMGGMTVNEVLSSGESNLSYDAGYYIPASIGDYVWFDQNGNGVQDTGEPGIRNAEVQLTGTDGQGNPVNETTYTNATGYYLFDNLVPGSYKLTFITPAGGYVPTDQDQGGNDGFDSDANPANGMTVYETLTSGEHNPTYDAGFYVEATIGNYVWEDLNANGLQDQGEPGIPNVSVTLTGNTGSGEPVNLNDLTDANGLYLFDHLQPGTYKLTFGTPGAPYVPTMANDPDDATDALDSDADPNNGLMTVFEVLEAGEVNLTYDAGFYRPASIGDYTWIDANGNGVQDGGEDPLPGVTVILTGTDGQGNPVNLTDVTDGNGEYLFDNLVPGTYKLTFPNTYNNYVVTDTNQGNNDATDSDADPNMGGMTVFEVLTSGEENLSYDAGYYEPAEIGNYTWIDENANGIQDGNESPLPNVLVILTGTTGSGEPVNETALTDANGLYLFDNLQPGAYKLTFQTPAGGYVPTTANDPDANPDDSDDSDANPAMGGMTVTEILTTGESNLTYDAGYYIPASIGDFVWNDLNANGIQEPGETGIPNVTVTLTGTNGQGNQVNQTTKTDGLGYYLFHDLMPGSYKLTFSTPAGFDYTSPLDAGGDDAFDSDANPAMSGMTVYETLVSGEHNPDYDAGFYECPEITILDLPVDQPICPLAEVGAIHLITDPGATTISWTGGSAIGLADGSAPGPIADIPAFIATAEGTVTVTVTAVLGECNITKTFSLEVNDDEAPIIANCPPDITVDNYPGQCGASPTWDEPIATDDCATPSNTLTMTQTQGLPSGSFLGASHTPYVIHYVADDGNGNTSECEFTIVVEDNEDPTIVCPPDVTVTTSSNGTGDCSFDMPDFIPDAQTADNCDGVLNVVQTPPAGTQISGAHGAQFDVLLVVTDPWGNSASCTVEVTLHDDEKPQFASTPTTPIDVACAELVPPVPPVTATDNCSTPNVQMDYTEITDPGPCLNSFTITRIWTATDIAGNSTSVTQVINVSDTQKPALVGLPVDITVFVECSEDVPEVPEVTATDNCGAPVDVDFTEVEVPGTCPNQYQIVRTWTAEDACGNSTSFAQTITISDTEKPELLISTTVTIPVTATWNFDASSLSGASSNTAFITTANAALGSGVDQDGYPAGCSSSHMLAVEDWHSSPTSTEYVDFKFTTKPGTMFHLSNIAFDHTRSSGGPNGYKVKVDGVEVGTGAVTNSCGHASINVNLNYGSSTTVTIRITGTGASDDHGDLRIDNVVLSGESVETVTIPSVVNVECAEDVPAVPDVKATDNCNKPLYVDFSETTVPGSCPNQYSVVRTWVVTDDCGNSSSFVQTINVNDTKAPELLVKPLRLHLACIDDVPAAPYQTATDNCGVAYVDFSESADPGDCLNSTIITRRWVAYDLCGNTTEWEQEIIVLDTFPPVLSATPLDLTVECSEAIPPAPVQTATDNCGVVTIDFAETTEPGGCENSYTIVRRWYAYDLCGNTDEHWQHITVKDTEAPVLHGLPTEAQVTGDCTDDLPAIPTVTATDNCLSPIDVEFSETITPGDCANAYTITRTWSAQDACGNATSFTQTITINDTEAPVLHGLPTEAQITGDCTDDLPAVPTVTATDN